MNDLANALPWLIPIISAGITWGIVRTEISNLRKDFDKWENRVFKYIVKEKE